MNPSRLSLAIGLVLTNLPVSTLLAAETTDEVLVTASAIDDEAVINVLTLEPAPNSGQTTGDFIRNLNGVSGSRMGGHGIDPSIRGQDQTQLNVLLDGAYVHGGCPNRMDPPTSYAPLASYDKVTLIRGVQTLAYGGGGSGGTLLLERSAPTFQAGPETHAHLEVGYRSNSDTKSLALGGTSGSKEGYVRIELGGEEAGNYEDGNGEEVSASYSQRNGFVAIGLTPDANSLYEISFEANRMKDVLYEGASMDSPLSDNNTVRFKFHRNNLPGVLSGYEGEIYSSEITHVMDNYTLRTRTAPASMRAPTTSDTYGGRLSTHFKTSAGELTLGVDHQENDKNAELINDTMGMTMSLMWPGVETVQTGLFAEHRFDLNSTTRLTAGVRYDHVSAKATKADEIVPGGVAPPKFRNANAAYNFYYGTSDNAVSENNWGGLLRLEKDLNDGLTLYGTLSRSIRTADATERFIFRDLPLGGDWIGNPDLAPEKHHQVEVGATFRPGADLELTGSLFYNQVSDFILRDSSTGNTLYRNVDATLYGAEASLNKHWGPWNGSLGLAFVHGDNTSDNKPLPQIAPLEVSADLSYQASDWSLGGRVRAAADQDRIDPFGGDVNSPTDSWAVLDLYGKYQIARGASLRLGVDNVFDENYAQHLNRLDPTTGQAIRLNEPGRSAWIKLAVEF